MLSRYWKMIWVLFGVFLIANVAYLGSVPGLLGDEGSEGENVYELLQSDHLVVQGERSYIGPLIDYVRVPFVKTFGYTALSLRVVMLLVSCATFWFAASVLKKLFGETPSLFGLALGFFNPIYLTQARLGWAITLIPFFTFLILWLLSNPQGLSRFHPHRARVAEPSVRPAGGPQRATRWALLVGLIAGIGLANHILFLPTLLGIAFVGLVGILTPTLISPSGEGEKKEGVFHRLFSWWPALVGFWAGFGMQFVILLTSREDQGDVVAVAESFMQRVHDLPKLLPLVLSGSSYVASYTGQGFSDMWQWGISGAIIVLIAAAVILPHFAKASRGLRFASSLFFLGLVIQTIVLLYMIDRFSLRYFAAPVIGRWVLAGVGAGIVTEWALARFQPPQILSPYSGPGVPEFGRLRSLSPILIALLLIAWSTFSILIPFLRTGGSTNDFSLGNRTDSAAALVDTRPLLECARGIGPVFSENVHIWNRLQYLSHQYPDIEILSEDQKDSARYLIEYRDAKHSHFGVQCSELSHFQLVAH